MELKKRKSLQYKSQLINLKVEIILLNSQIFKLLKKKLKSNEKN